MRSILLIGLLAGISQALDPQKLASLPVESTAVSADPAVSSKPGLTIQTIAPVTSEPSPVKTFTSASGAHITTAVGTHAAPSSAGASTAAISASASGSGSGSGSGSSTSNPAPAHTVFGNAIAGLAAAVGLAIVL